MSDNLNPQESPTISATDNPTIWEHYLLRAEMNTYFDQLQKLEVFALPAIFFAYGWLILQGQEISESTPLFSLIYVGPLLMSLAVYRRVRGTRYRIARLAYYIAFLEQEMGLSCGWEHFVWKTRGVNLHDCKEIDDFSNRIREKADFQEHISSIVGMWSLVVCASFAISLILLWNSPFYELFSAK